MDPETLKLFGSLSSNAVLTGLLIWLLTVYLPSREEKHTTAMNQAWDKVEKLATAVVELSHKKD